MPGRGSRSTHCCHTAAAAPSENTPAQQAGSAEDSAGSSSAARRRPNTGQKRSHRTRAGDHRFGGRCKRAGKPNEYRVHDAEGDLLLLGERAKALPQRSQRRLIVKVRILHDKVMATGHGSRGAVRDTREQHAMIDSWIRATALQCNAGTPGATGAQGGMVCESTPSSTPR